MPGTGAGLVRALGVSPWDADGASTVRVFFAESGYFDGGISHQDTAVSMGTGGF